MNWVVVGGITNGNCDMHLITELHVRMKKRGQVEEFTEAAHDHQHAKDAQHVCALAVMYVAFRIALVKLALILHGMPKLSRGIHHHHLLLMRIVHTLTQNTS
ncbi:hypothetical protein Ahy_A08g039744 isoform B [Arachis hypogaea]|uniref:Uncharacterized protein n=1 Tax=Arachis hypogaea TaxID=3818 RepID=A0A445BXM9_ARAHY|nr:hypothetical protein Ahy_A08g039744 isoform B [Arachis hypogaea]